MTIAEGACRACGAPLQGGRFCGACGVAAGQAGSAECSRCRGSLPPEARFCLNCGQPVGGQRRRSVSLPWILGAAAFATILAAVFVKERQARPTPSASPVSANAAGSGIAPDISQMSPRERFDRLYNRVMQASETGDTATVSQFTSMALAAYGMLDSVDADARYHAAMLRLHTGDGAGAAALADTILVGDPTHLLGFVIHGTIARWERDQAALAAAQRRFLAAYEAEQSSSRSEYRDHKTIIDRFLDEARKAVAP